MPTYQRVVGLQTITASHINDLQVGIEGAVVNSLPAGGINSDEIAIVGGVRAWRLRPVVNAVDFGVIGDGLTDNVSQITALFSTASDGAAIVFPRGVYATSGQIGWSGKALSVRFERGAVIKESGTLTVPVVKLTAAHGSQLRGLTIEGSETVATATDSTKFGIEIELSDDVSVDGLTVTGKSRAVILDRCGRASVRNVSMVGLLGSATTAPAGVNYHSGLLVNGCTHSTFSDIRGRDIGSVVLQEGIGAWPTGNSFVQLVGRNIFDSGAYLSGGTNCVVADSYIEMDVGKTPSIGSAAFKARGYGNRIIGCAAWRTWGGLMLTGVTAVADTFGANGHAQIASGFIARNCVGPGIVVSELLGLPGRDFVFSDCEVHDCVSNGEAYGSVHITSGIGHRVEGVKVVGHLCSSAAIILGGTLAAPVRRPALTNCQVVWPDTSPPSRRSILLSFVDDGDVDGLVLVNTGNVGVQLQNANRCRIMPIKGVNISTSATVEVTVASGGGTTDSNEIWVGQGGAIVTDAGTNTNFQWPPGRYVAVTAAYSVAANDGTIEAATGAGVYTVTLPIANRAKNRTITVKRTATSNITVDGNGSETIDGALTKRLDTQYGYIDLLCDGVGWHIVGQFGTIT